MTVQQSGSKLRKLGAGLGIFQSLTWIVLSMICIILYYSPHLSTLSDSYMETIGKLIYAMFLYTSQEVFPNQTFSGNVFNAFMWLYILLDLVWLVACIYLLCKNTLKAAKVWSYCTLIISFLDFITFVILGADYNKCMDYAQDFSLIGETYVLAIQQACANSILPPFIIAAKGFTLWVFNIGIAVAVILDTKSWQR
ncbi:hypothetical protein Zmor_005152 [Zophobas morio]|uniref:Uncharacterized protein n=1 Tax=Zophobas morio TaxID=2755281 RepID=A0AA38IUS0_9CUCU|nr:hypothetical protein Zmor_005152 [Zophobas morio]